METVFEAENNVEAHMIVHLLEQAGIEAQILGEHLQGGVGELPATGNIRVLVEADDVAKAKSIIAEWQAQNKAEPQSTPAAKKPSPWTPLITFVAGAGIASAYLLWAFNSPVGPRTSDLNRDGEPDEWYYWRGDTLSRVEQDRDHDGKADAVFTYTARDHLETGEFDDDFDGTFELTVFYRYGQPKTDEFDVDDDGHPERRGYYVEGVLRRIEHYRPGTRIIRKTQRFGENGLISEARLDLDNDGIVDTLIKYNELEEEISREAITRE